MKKRTPRSALIQSRGIELRKDDVSHCLKGGGGGTSKNFVVYGAATTTSTQTKSTRSTSERKATIQETLEPSDQKRSRTSPSFVLDFLANPSLLPARGRVSRTLMERFSMRYSELRGLRNLAYYSLKTSLDSSAKTREEPLPQFFDRWMTWGIGLSGRCLTANTTVSHRTAPVSSLSDILEESVADQYFLSKKAVDTLEREQKKGRARKLCRESREHIEAT